LSGLGQVAKQSTKRLGPGADLVNVLPSTVLVATVFALISSHLYPWASPLHDASGKVIRPGFESVAHTAQGIKLVGGVTLVFVVLLVAVALRPFQIVAVQFLEGYWRRRSFLWSLAIERHTRRLTASRSRRKVTSPRSKDLDLNSLAENAQRGRRIDRMTYRAGKIIESYPERIDNLLPTSLGNVLRRAETSSGERYGLNTVITYPRLYPHLSARLDKQMATYFDLLDAMAALTLVFGGQALVTTPLAARLDRWSLVPMVFVAFALVAYRGAHQAARHHALALATTYDLHRFDMLKALHRRLPDDAEQEYRENEKLSEFFRKGQAVEESERANWKYEHPSAEPQAGPATNGDSGPPDE
jgi:hypothetical protein